MFIQERNFGTRLALRCGHTDGIHNSGNHIHQFCELEMVLDGEIEITVSGRTYTAKKGDIAIIPPFTVHSFYTPVYVKQLICVFSTSFISDAVSFEELTRARTPSVFHASEPLWNYLVSIGLPELQTKHSFDPEQDRNYIHRLKSVFHLIMAEHFNTAEITNRSGLDYALSKILLYISEHYTENISLAKVGEAIGYSPKYVSNCFRTMPEISFRGMINSLRIEKAASLLSDTDKSNMEIAMECGFSTNIVFHRVFAEVMGTTPGQYRKRKRVLSY